MKNAAEMGYNLGYFEALKNVVVYIPLTTPEQYRDWLTKELNIAKLRVDE